MKKIQAFPSETKDVNGDYNKGMTLRDYFAGQAIISIGSHGGNSRAEWAPEDFDQLAEKCYKLADAMIEKMGVE